MNGRGMRRGEKEGKEKTRRGSGWSGRVVNEIKKQRRAWSKRIVY